MTDKELEEIVDLREGARLNLAIEGGPLERQRLFIHVCDAAIALQTENELLKAVARAAEGVEKQFVEFKEKQHKLLDNGLKEAAENWDLATTCEIDFSDIIAALTAAKKAGVIWTR